jgi:3,4-dihydroxy 2-butanone 4-phosphate synthase/GTP cyclohydrolase II
MEQDRRADTVDANLRLGLPGHAALINHQVPAEHLARSIDVSSLLGDATPGRDRPFVVLRYAQTLDGRILAEPAEPDLADTEARAQIWHALRAACDAVLVGVGTVLAGNPYLTVRAIPGRSPARVVLDSCLRTPLTAAVLNLDAPTYLMANSRVDDRASKRP